MRDRDTCKANKKEGEKKRKRKALLQQSIATNREYYKGCVKNKASSELTQQ